MIQQKELYSSPTTELFVVRFEENILSNPDGYHAGGGGYYDDEDTNNNGDY